MGFETLKFMCGAQYENFILASCSEFNALYKIYHKTGKNEYLGKFPNEKLISKSLHRNVFIINDFAYFIPYKADNIHIYDIKKGKIRELKIERNGYKGGYLGIQNNKLLYLIPESEGGEILEIDANTENIKKMVSADILSKIISNINVNKKHLFLRICLQDDRLWLPVHETDIILEVKLSSREITKYNFKINNIVGCFNGKDALWILGDQGKSVYKWDYKSDSLIKMLEEDKYNKAERCFNWIVDTGKHVYVLPAWGENIWIQKNHQFVKLKRFEKAAGNNQKFFEPICMEDYVYLLPMGIEHMIRIQGENLQKINLDKIDSESAFYKELLCGFIKDSSKEGINEKILSLNQFIDGLVMAYN